MKFKTPTGKLLAGSTPGEILEDLFRQSKRSRNITREEFLTGLLRQVNQFYGIGFELGNDETIVGILVAVGFLDPIQD